MSIPRTPEVLKEILLAISGDDSDFYMDLVTMAENQVNLAHKGVEEAHRNLVLAQQGIVQAEGLVKHYQKVLDDLVHLQSGLKRLDEAVKSPHTFKESEEFKTLYPRVVYYYQTDSNPSIERGAILLKSTKYKVNICRREGILKGNLLPFITHKRNDFSAKPGSIESWGMGDVYNIGPTEGYWIDAKTNIRLVNSTLKEYTCFGCGKVIPKGSKCIHLTLQWTGAETEHLRFHLDWEVPSYCLDLPPRNYPPIHVKFVEETVNA